MKKIIALVFMTALVVTVFSGMVVAQDVAMESDTRAEVSVTSSDERTDAEVAAESETTVSSDSDTTSDADSMESDGTTEDATEHTVTDRTRTRVTAVERSEKRESVRERFERTQDQYDAARVRHVEAKERLATARDRFTTARANWQEKRELAGDRAEEHRTALVKRAAEFQQNRLDVLREHASKLLAREYITQETFDDWDARITALEEIFSNEEVTREEVVAASEDFHALFVEIRAASHTAVANGLLNKIQHFIDQADNAYAKQSQVIDRLEAKLGAQVELRADLASFQQAVDEATTAYTAAQELFDAGAAPSEVNAAIRDAHKELQEAFRIMKANIKDIRKAIQDAKEVHVDASAEADAEVTVDAGTDDAANADDAMEESS